MSGMRWRDALYEVAAGQWGLFTASHARSLGAPYARLTEAAISGEFDRVAHGVYRVHGAPIHPHEALRAAWLSLAPDRTAADRLAADDPVGVVSHRSAAWIRELGDLDADVVEFTVSTRRRSRQPDQRFHVGSVAGQWDRVDGLPVMTPLRTIADLAAAYTDGGHLAGVLASALRSGLVSPTELADALAPHSRRYGLRRHDGALLVQHLIDTVSSA